MTSYRPITYLFAAALAACIMLGQGTKAAASEACTLGTPVCSADCQTCDDGCGRHSSHFLRRLPPIYGRNPSCDMHRVTECSGPPHGEFFGYYPTCWSKWPSSFNNCPVKEWPVGCGYEVVHPAHGQPVPAIAPQQAPTPAEAPMIDVAPAPAF